MISVPEEEAKGIDAFKAVEAEYAENRDRINDGEN